MSDTTATPISHRRNEHFSNRDNKTRRIDSKWPSPTRVSHQRLPWVQRRRASIVSRQGKDEQELSSNAEVRRPPAWRQFLSSFSLERSFTVLGFVVAVLLISVFGADLAWGCPFRHASSLFDASSVFCGAVLAYLSWDVFWEQIRGLTR
jgi:hypothetical protein